MSGGGGRDGIEWRGAYLSSCVLHGTDWASLSTATVRPSDSD
jgi:hypothetical protein